MRLERTQIAGIIIMLILISIVIMWALANKKNLLSNHKITNAIVNDCYSGGRGNLGTTILYKFDLDGKEITGSGAFSHDVLNLSDARSYILGKIFPVAYDPQHPSNNFLLLREKDFKQFDIVIPDSLHWLLKYVH